MRKLISLILTLLCVLYSLCLPVSAATFYGELTEDENVSILYDRVLNHYFFDCGGAYEAGIGGFYQNAPVTLETVPLTALITSAALAQRAYMGTAIFDEPVTISDFKNRLSQAFGDREIPLTDGKTYPLGELQTITFLGDIVTYDPIALSSEDISGVNYRAVYYVDRYEMQGDTLHIYDKYAVADIASLNNGVVTVYSSADKSEIVGYVAHDEETGMCAFEAALAGYIRSLPDIAMEFYPANHGNYFSSNADLSDFAEYETLLTEYKHTFRKNEYGDWIWYSSEPTDSHPSIPDTADGGFFYCICALFSIAFAAISVLPFLKERSAE